MSAADISSQEDMNGTGNEDQTDSSSKSSEKGSIAFEDAKATPKVIRVLTVMTYVLSVSMAAIMLSLYYILMWNPPDIYVNVTNKGIQSHRLQQSPTLDEMLLGMTTPDPPDTTVLPSTIESTEDLYEVASAKTKDGIFLSRLYPKYTNENNNVSNETLYK